MNKLSILPGVLVLVARMSSLAAGTIDIVSLGAKNDGSEDVSAIVNADGTLAAVTAEDGVTYRVENGVIVATATLGEVVAEAGKTYEATL